MKTKKVLGFLIIIMLMISMAGCGTKPAVSANTSSTSGSTDNSSGTTDNSTTTGDNSATTKNNPPASISPSGPLSREQFINIVKGEVDNLSRIYDKYGVPYDKNNNVDSADTVEGVEGNIQPKSDTDIIVKDNDSSGTTYQLLSYEAELDNNGKLGSRYYNLNVVLGSNTQIDINKMSMLKDIMTSIQGSSIFSAASFNQTANDVISTSIKNNSGVGRNVPTDNYKESISYDMAKKVLKIQLAKEYVPIK